MNYKLFQRVFQQPAALEPGNSTDKKGLRKSGEKAYALSSPSDEHITAVTAMLKKQSPVFGNRALAGVSLGGSAGRADIAKGRRLRDNLTGIVLLMRPVDSTGASIKGRYIHLHGPGRTLLVSTIEAALHLLHIFTYWLRRGACYKVDSATGGLRRCWRLSEGMPGKQTSCGS
jgi:hypothetical protein